MVHVPVWNWFDGAYKVRAAKAASNIAQMNLGMNVIVLDVNAGAWKLETGTPPVTP